jgi:hypothetical protein
VSRATWHGPVVRITSEHQRAETRFRELLASAGIAEPDAVEYEPGSVLFLWHDRKLAVFVDLASGGNSCLESD